jgi:hypothetical protein
MRHRAAGIVLVAAILASSFGSATVGDCAEKRGAPNVVFILADDKY